MLRLQAVPVDKLIVVSDDLPGDTSHGRRVLRFGPDGLLYFAIGVPCNVCKLRMSGNFQFGTIYKMNVTTGEATLVATGRKGKGMRVWGMDPRPPHQNSSKLFTPQTSYTPYFPHKSKYHHHFPHTESTVPPRCTL